MNRVILIAFSTLLFGSVSAQDWGGGWGSSEPAASQGKMKKPGATANVNVNAKGKGGATATVTTPEPVVAAPAAVAAFATPPSARPFAIPSILFAPP